MKTYFIKYTKIDKDDKKWNESVSFIHKTEEYLEDLKDLETSLLKALKDTDFHKITIDVVSFLNDIPQKQKKNI